MPKHNTTDPAIKMLSTFLDWHKLTWSSNLCYANYLYAKDTAIDVSPPDHATALRQGKLYSDASGSLAGEIFRRCDRLGANAASDNSVLYVNLCKYLRGSKYEKSGEAFEEKRDGVGFLCHLKLTYATDDAHEGESKTIEVWLDRTRWSGPGNGQLVTTIEKMRNQFARLKECAKHCNIQLPDARKEVSFLLQAITCKDPMICAYLVQIREQDGTGEDYRNSFEKSAVYLAKCPYQGKNETKQLKKNRFSADVSGLNVNGNGGGGGGGGGGGSRGMVSTTKGTKHH